MTSEKEWNSIIEYIQQKLQERIYEIVDSVMDAVSIDVLAKKDIDNLQEIAPYADWLVSAVNSKKKVVKKPVEGKYQQQWKAFWEIWPSTKSVPDTQFKSGAKMKSDEQKMYQKWLKLIECEGVGEQWAIDQVYKAADCYLKWGYYDSIRKGKNELEVRSGMEPWLNQKQYLIYANMEYPPVQKKQVVYENSTDM